MLRVSVGRPGAETESVVTLDVPDDLTVKGFKRDLLSNSSTDCKASMHLVYGGSVRRDEEQLSQLVSESLSTGTFWLVRSVQEQCIKSTKVKELTSAGGIGLAQLGIVRLSHVSPSNERSMDFSTFADLFRSFASFLAQPDAPWRPSAQEQTALANAISALDNAISALDECDPGRVPPIRWFESYGCALLASASRVGVVSLRLVCLDEWQFQMHSTGHQRTPTADATGEAMLYVGEVGIDKYGDFIRRASALLKEKEKETTKPKQTPPTILEVLKEALCGPSHDEISSNAAGFTTVGSHDTSWALVQAVLLTLLEESGLDFFHDHLIAQLLLWLAEQSAASYSTSASSKEHRSSVNSIMQILKCAVKAGASLSDRQTNICEGEKRLFDMQVFAARCVVLRHELEQLVHCRAQQRAKRFELPPQSRSALECRSPQLSLPSLTRPPLEATSLNKARAMAQANLGWLPAPTPSDVAELLTWLSHDRLRPGRGDAASLLVMETVERVLLSSAPDLAEGVGCLYEQDEEYSRNWVDKLEQVLDMYFLVVCAFRSTKSATALLAVERDSRELLVVWCAYCFVHKATLPFEYRVLAPYDVALDPDKLEPLVLSEKVAVEAAQHVTAYLRRHTKSRPKVFSLCESDMTFDMAMKYSSISPDIQMIWKLEQSQAALRQDEHWQTVQRKKNALVDLDAELQRLESDLEAAKRNARAFSAPSEYTSYENDREWRAAQDDIQRRTRLVSQKEEEIRSMEIPPDPIYQPLPSDCAKAMQWLFFLRMPKRFQVLSRLSFVAQQMLLPSTGQIHVAWTGATIDIRAKTDVPSANEWLHEYYHTRSTGRHLSKSETVMSELKLGFYDEVPAKRAFSPANVRSFHSPSVGIWHPDCLGPRLFWSGGKYPSPNRSQYFNPFATLESDAIISKFTEMLPDSKMQWSMGMGCNPDCSRGNVPEARQDISLSWLPGKKALLSFGAMRAYPRQQVRKVLVALHERALPLDEPSVRKLLQQTFFQLGKLSSDDTLPQPIWRTDLFDHGGWDALRLELESLADELQDKPRQHGAILVLGEIAAHASQWDAATREVARRFARIARTWSNESIASETPVEAAHSCALRRIFCKYTICCHGAGEIEDEDVEALCAAAVLGEYSRLFEAASPLESKAGELSVVSKEVMARRLHELLPKLDHDSRPLTAAVKAVLETVTPDSLCWEPLVYDGVRTACYEAVGESHGGEPHLFSVNLFTGTVLYDGLPPRRLPQSILDVPLYKRTFGNLNFEVLPDSSGIFKTVRLHAGFRFEFFVDSTARLVVREVDPQDEEALLELLYDPCHEGETWGQQLPIRLQQMHSHWLCRSLNTVILRPKSIRQGRSCQFLLLRNDNWQCYRVPNRLVNTGWQKLRELTTTFDQLRMPNDSDVMNVLTKFETQAGLVHVYHAAKTDALVFELPRYDLSFELDEEGNFASKNFQGFALASHQQMPDVLGDFSQYLLLNSAHQQLLIVPTGNVTIDDHSGAVIINGPTACDSVRHLHTYEVHPRFLTLESRAGATAIEARLQLAALYAAIGTELPEGRSKQTGGEVAIELLRQSWQGSPMKECERLQLQNILKFGCLTPALPLLCFELSSASHELQFLYKITRNSMPLDADAASAYHQLKQRGELNCRAVLTPDEEMRVMGASVSGRPRGSMPRAGDLNLPHFEKLNRELDSVERTLREMLVSKQAVEQLPLPLSSADLQNSSLGVTVLAELSKSWLAYQSLPKVSLAKDIAVYEVQMRVLHYLVRVFRDRVEQQVIKCINVVPESAGWHVPAFVMRRAANFATWVTLRDLAHAAVVPHQLWQFNPFLSQAAVNVLHTAILQWLQLCVLEDKLKRMVQLAGAADEQELLRELKEVGRSWDVRQYPQWLVFEVEQGLQIRNVQYKVFCSCIEEKGVITQLNMGEGKTRVILPMLLMQFGQPGHLVRLHFLSPLMDEAYAYLHRHLTASVMKCRLLRLPFDRHVRLTTTDVQKMLDSLKRCMNSYAAVCVAPEHRLSLQLKSHEMRLSGKHEIVKWLSMLDELPFFDLFDESDEILHHKYQLIYAWGEVIMLPDGKERWEATKALLGVLQTSTAIRKILECPNVAHHIAMVNQHGSGSFDDLRLLPGPELDDVRLSLLRTLAFGLMDNPPYHMLWLKAIKDSELKETLVCFMVNPRENLASLHESPINQQQRSQLLALRGLLAYGLLERGLSRRHHVDFGVDPRRGIKQQHDTSNVRRVAVPYRASATPSERSEYAHPDTMIVLTYLSYYHTGLSRDEIKEAVSGLLLLGPSAQKAHYELWFESARDSMGCETEAALNKVDKLDISNDMQLNTLHAVYRYNMATINFWLEHCVLPRETMQFPSRLVANAFNLTDNPRGQLAGFSGTKDNSILLPFHVSQQIPSDAPDLLATDGKMFDLLVRNAEVVCLTSDTALRLAVLELAFERRTNALIDAGAAMSGLSNEEVADQLIKIALKLPEHERPKGIVYFKPDEATWVVRSLGGNQWLQSRSPILERDCFVYFDESRCRGADMKLLPRAVGVLTVSLTMCRDKIMQAAGRMRKLDRGQRLILALPPEVTPRIHELGRESKEEISSLLVLKWVIRNTVSATAAGFPEFFSQASHFCMTQDPAARLLMESLELEESYGRAINEITVPALVDHIIERDIGRCTKLGISYSDQSQTLVLKMKASASQYCSDLMVISTGVDEECERELENERELERERDIELPKLSPASPKEWDFKKIITAQSICDVPQAAGVMTLERAVAERLQRSLSAILWEHSNIYVTSAFLETVEDQNGQRVDDISNFLRPVDIVVVLPSSEVLLLSEWEAEHILSLMWKTDHATSFMTNLVFLLKAADTKWSSECISLSVPSAGRQSTSKASCAISERTIAALQLFAGHTMFSNDERKRCVANLVVPAGAKKAALELVALRGQKHMIPRSDLELICNLDTSAISK